MKYFIVAELGIAHAGDMNLAKEMIRATADAGVDAAKLQFYDWKDIKDEFEGRPDLLDKVKQAQLDIRQIRKLRDYMAKEGVEFVCTPFKTRQKLLQLARLHPYAIKIRFRDGPNSSPDGVGLVQAALDSRLVTRVFASCLIPPFDKMGVFYSPKVSPKYSQGAWMYCLPAYPPNPEDFSPMQSTGFQGFSDHYPNLTASLLAAALTRYEFYVIEKHVRFPYQTDVPDAPVSIDFGDLGMLVRHLRLYEKLKPENKFWFPTIPPAPKRRQPKPA